MKALYFLSALMFLSLPLNSVSAGDRPKGLIHFMKEDWRIHQEGEIKAGGELTIIHDDERLPHCRGTYHGLRVWSIVAFVKFLPSGKVVTGDVTGDWVAKFEIPSEGVEAIEVWFFNSGRCEQFYYDSNHSRNFLFDVN